MNSDSTSVLLSTLALPCTVIAPCAVVTLNTLLPVLCTLCKSKLDLSMKFLVQSVIKIIGIINQQVSL